MSIAARQLLISPNLRIIRVQAQKTLDVFLQRVRTLTENYPETASPPPQATDGATGAAVAVANIPRIGTPQTDDSWAGWAISSFTKNLSKAVGELESTNNTAAPASNGSSGMGPRTSSEPSIGKLGVLVPTPRATSPAPSSNLRKSFTTPAVHKPSGFLGDDDNEDNDPDAWGDLEEESFFDTPAAKPPPAMVDSEELDFASLIQPKKKELPKGLSKPATTTRASVVTSPKISAKASTVAGSSATATKAKTATASLVAKKPVTTALKKPVAAKTEEKDGWGNDDGWDDGW